MNVSYSTPVGIKQILNYSLEEDYGFGWLIVLAEDGKIYKGHQKTITCEEGQYENGSPKVIRKNLDEWEWEIYIDGVK